MAELFGEESAKAIQEIAKTGQQFGGFFSHYFGGTIEQWVGLWEDKLRYRRFENQVALMLKAEEKIKSLGLEGKLKPLNFKIAVPLLEAASLEDDNYLKELWANLLVNSARKDKSDTHPAFIQVLQNISFEEAKILKYGFDNKNADNVILSIESKDQNYHIYLLDEKKIEFAKNLGLDSYQDTDILMWFDNLNRLKLLEYRQLNDYTYEEGYAHWNPEKRENPKIITYYDESIYLSFLGVAFVKAVTE